MTARIGILGGGQLGRMSILAGRRLGMRFSVYEPNGPSPAGRIADRDFGASFEDRGALEAFAATVDLATVEFENVPRFAAEAVAKRVPFRPSIEVLYVCQHRLREKRWLTEHGIPCTPFAVAGSEDELRRAVGQIGVPCVVKTAAFGYDGKGQQVVDGGTDLSQVYRNLAVAEGLIVEAFVDFDREVSLVIARGEDGETALYPMVENIHRNRILHKTIAPARVSEEVARAGRRLAVEIAERLSLVGVLGVEMFLLRDGGLWVNELAPRPHNSGHFTVDACVTSQFEQHVRAVAGLPLGSPEQHTPAVMLNLLGEAFTRGAWELGPVLRDPTLKVHMYDKTVPRVGRKMGHVTLLDHDLAAAENRANALWADWVGEEDPPMSD